jgi:putative salt-induced outer membrane protein
MTLTRARTARLVRTGLPLALPLALSSAIALLTVPAHAQAPAGAAATSPSPAGSPQGFSGKGELGYVNSTGNSTAVSANAKLDLADTAGRWKHLLHGEALYARSAGIVSAERLLGSFQSNYQLTRPAFLFGQLLYTNDKFSGFAYQASATAGIGYALLATPTNQLSVQIGAGYRSLRPETLVKNAAGQVIYRIPGAVSDGAIGTAAVNFEHDFSATTKLTDKAQTQFGGGDTLLQNDLAVQVQMTTRLALSVGYSLQDNTSPPPGVKALETFTTLNLVFQL